MKRAYLYHKTKEPQIFLVSDIEDMKEQGWNISPVPFIKTTDFGVDPKDQEKVQMMGESILGVRDFINGELNLDLMTMKELKAYAKAHFDFKLYKLRNKQSVIQAIRGDEWQQHKTLSQAH